jgi:uncharacterized protein (DUF1501 family)
MNLGKYTRRDLLGLAALALGGARASGTPPKRVLVGIGLLGGNDSNNLVVPLDPRTYKAYANGRGELALPVSSLIPVRSARLKSTFGLPKDAPELAGLYRRKALAVVANVGDVLRPTTKTEYYADWLSGMAEDAGSHIASSKMQFLAGGWVVPRWWSGLLKESAETFDKEVFKFGNGMTAAWEDSSRIAGARLDNPTLLKAVDSVRIRTNFPGSGIGGELLRAVKLAYAGADLGVENQIVTCVMSGWNTHEYEMEWLARLYGELSQALSAFYDATVELGMERQVTAFTWSEFNRALAPNDTHGAEHGFGGHQLVVGGSVAGGEIYGTFPSLELRGPDDVSGHGSWLPSTSTVQYAATFANWFGLSAEEQKALWPTLASFRVTNLGFLK